MVSVGEAVGYLNLDASKFKQGFSSALADLKVFQNETATANDKLAATGSAMVGVGSTLTKSVTLPIVGAGAAAAKFALGFEEGTAKFGTLVDKNVMSVDDMSKSILALSTDVGVSATDLTEAMYQTLSATNDTANAMGYLETAAKLAKGGFTETETAIDGVTSVMNAYGETGQEAFQKIADTMIVTQNLGKTTVGELSSALFNVTPAAAAAGVSFDQVSAALAAMTAQGTPTSVATTQLRSAIQAFTKPSTEMIGAIKGVSKELIDQEKISGPLVEAYQAEQKVLADLNEEYDKLDQSTKEGKAAAKGLESAMKEQVKEVDKAAAGLGKLIIESEGLDGAFKMASDAAGGNSATLATMMGSVEGLNAVLQLTSDQGATKYSGALETMQNSSGETEKAFEAMAATTAENMEKLKATLEVVAIQIGDIILPSILGAIQSVSEGLKKFSEMDESTKKMIVAFAGVAAAIGPVLIIVGKVVSAISSIGAAVSAAGGLTSAFGAAFTALTGPIGLIIAGVAALVAAFATDFGGIRTVVMDVVNSIKETLTVWFGWLTDAWDSNLGGIKDIVAAIMKGIETSMAVPLEAIRALFVGAFQLLRGDFDGFKETVNAFFTNMGTIFLDFVNSVLAIFGTNWSELSTLTASVWESVKQAVANAVDGIISFVTETIPNMVQNIIQWFEELPYNLGYVLGQVLAKIIEVFGEIGTFIVVKVPEIITGIIEWFKKLPDELGLWLSKTFDNLKRWGKDSSAEASASGAKILDSITEKVKKIPDEFKKWFGESLTYLGGLGKKFWDAGVSILTGLFDGMKSIGDGIVSWVSNLFDSVMDFVNGIIDGMKDADRASEGSRKSSSRSVSGSYAAGLDYVPRDMTVRVHEGEAIVTKEQNASRGERSGDVFNFYSPVALTPVESARQMKKAKQELALGFM